MSTATPARPVALVLGASRGLGYLCARELLDRGYRVVIASRSQESCDRARHRLMDDGTAADDVVAHACDVRDGRAVADLIDRIETGLGQIDVGLHVAGIIQVGPWSEWDTSQFADAMDTMAWGPIHMALPLAKAMVERGHGRIGIVSSVGGQVPFPHLLPYSTAKFAALGFGRGLNAELAGTGVTVTSVAPGLMRVGSHLAAEFVGDQEKEYAWFAVGAAAPLLAIDAETAARRVVVATLRGRAFESFTPAARIGGRLAGVAPTITTHALGVVARLMPRATNRADPVTGREVETRLAPASRSVLRVLTTLGRRAARRNLETAPGADP